MGTNILQVLAASARTGGISQGAGSASTLTWEDAQAIAKQVPAAEAVSAFLYHPNIQVVRGNVNISTTGIGTDLNFPRVSNIQPQQGVFFRQQDLDIAKNALTGVAINGFWLQSSNADQLESAQFQVTNVLRLRHHIRPPKEDDFRVTNKRRYH